MPNEATMIVLKVRSAPRHWGTVGAGIPAGDDCSADPRSHRSSSVSWCRWSTRSWRRRH